MVDVLFIAQQNLFIHPPAPRPPRLIIKLIAQLPQSTRGTVTGSTVRHNIRITRPRTTDGRICFEIYRSHSHSLAIV